MKTLIHHATSYASPLLRLGSSIGSNICCCCCAVKEAGPKKLSIADRLSQPDSTAPQPPANGTVQPPPEVNSQPEAAQIINCIHAGQSERLR